MRQPAGASQIDGATEDRDDHQDEHHHQEPDHHGQLKQCPPGGRIRRPRFLGPIGAPGRNQQRSQGSRRARFIGPTGTIGLSAARISLPRTAYSPIASWRSWTVRSSPWRLPNQATVRRSGSSSAPVGTPSTRPTKLLNPGSHPPRPGARNPGWEPSTKPSPWTPPAAYSFGCSGTDHVALPGHERRRYAIGLDLRVCPLRLPFTISGAGQDRLTREEMPVGPDDRPGTRPRTSRAGQGRARPGQR